MDDQQKHTLKKNELLSLLEKRIVILDGPKGTMIQSMGLTEDTYRGSVFANHPQPLIGNNDVLNLTKPELIKHIHRNYVEAGADIIGTNTFNANKFSQADYGTDRFVYEINLAGAKLAREVADQSSRPIFVAGTIGPTNKSASIATDPQNPHKRSVTFKELVQAYAEQIRGLLDGGVHLLLVETIFDSLNAKAAAFAILQIFEERGIEIPVCFSVTVSDKSGRLLNGQTLIAFCYAIEHVKPLAIGLNCGMGPEQMRPFLRELAENTPWYVICYPNAGLPDATGRYTLSPEHMAATLAEYAREGLLNIVGGCCGSRPEHIKAITEVVKNIPPRKRLPTRSRYLRLSGLEPLELIPGQFTNIGERTNVAGSSLFAKAIRNGDLEKASQIARQQVENGAQILDVCVDDPMLDQPRVLQDFLNTIMSYPVVARVPIMIDSTSWTVIEAGLQCLPGKGLVNSLTLKEGPAEFIRRAKLAYRYGAAIVVMAVDEQGQAETFERKIEIAKRAYDLLLAAGIPAENIVFDPNVFAIGTDDENQKAYALDFIRAVRWIKEHLPGVATSGGISNVSYAFKGNSLIRRAMNSIFLYHAIQAGLDMGIVNPAQIQLYVDITPELRTLVEDVLFARTPDAVDRLLAFAQKLEPSLGTPAEAQDVQSEWRSKPVEERLQYAILHGITEYLETDVVEALQKYKTPLAVVDGPLMTAMNRVGDLFAEGKMFLPQVVKAARVMRHAVSILERYFQEDGKIGSSKRAKIVLATVKGDVHDIGKNIVATVLRCNGFEVIDLGIMVPPEKIVEAVKQFHADLVGLSGLITPSLEEMVRTAEEMERSGLRVPLLIGGAATSKLHTALKIAPKYRSPVIHVPDASQAIPVTNALLDPKERQTFLAHLEQEYTQVRYQYYRTLPSFVVPFEEAQKRSLKIDHSLAPIPEWKGLLILGDSTQLAIASETLKHLHLHIRTLQVSIDDLIPYMNWTAFFNAWGLKGVYPNIIEDPVVGPEAKRLFKDAEDILSKISKEGLLHPAGVLGIFPAVSQEEFITIRPFNGWPPSPITLHFFREQSPSDPEAPCPCLADFVPPSGSERPGYIGAFALTTGHGLKQLLQEYAEQNDNYTAMIIEVLADRLVEAFSEFAHRVITALWQGLPISAPGTFQTVTPQGIRPAVGYPIWPDHSEKINLWKLLLVEQIAGIKLTENYMMIPPSSVCGIYIIHPQANYFQIKHIGLDQLEKYCERAKKPKDAIIKLIHPFLPLDGDSPRS